jgi:hypothetical protein
MAIELIVYACPAGILADQLETYFAAAHTACGPNTAHRYMPHCTLTGFFHDDITRVPFYAHALAEALHAAQATRPTIPVHITEMIFQPDFHGLLLEAPWLYTLVADFAQRAKHSPTRQDDLRLKDWLHLSLAYGFAPQHAAQLATIARQHVDSAAPVEWELRLYERQPGDIWVLHWGHTL